MKVIYEGKETRFYRCNSLENFAKFHGAEVVSTLAKDLGYFQELWLFSKYSSVLKLELKSLKMSYSFLLKQASVKLTIYGPDDGVARLEAIILEETEKLKP